MWDKLLLEYLIWFIISSHTYHQQTEFSHHAWHCPRSHEWIFSWEDPRRSQEEWRCSHGPHPSATVSFQFYANNIKSILSHSAHRKQEAFDLHIINHSVPLNCQASVMTCLNPWPDFDWDWLKLCSWTLQVMLAPISFHMRSSSWNNIIYNEWWMYCNHKKYMGKLGRH